MEKYSTCFMLVAIVTLVVACTSTASSTQQAQLSETASPLVPLPTPFYESLTSLELTLLERRSVRDYRPEPLTMAEVSQLLWAAQGVTDESGLRTSPSAGALFPLEIYLVAGNVIELPAGIYHYQPQSHALLLLLSGDQRQALYTAALHQRAVKDAAAVIVIDAVYERTTQKYGERGKRYAHIEAGCVTQNIYLQAESLDLGTVFIGAFHDEAIRQLLGIGMEEQPLGLMPVGRK